MPRAAITLEGPEASVVRQALSPESGRDVPKARVTVSGSGRKVLITIDADDTGALRAAVNSYLHWSDVAARVRQEVTP